MASSISWRRTCVNICLYGVIAVLVVVLAFPLYWMLTTSLMTQWEAFNWPPLLYPKSWQFQNYSEMAARVPLIWWFKNSVTVAVLQVCGATASSMVVAYAFARFDFPLKGPLFMLTLGTMMFPAQITLIPQFLLFHKLGWINSFKPLVVPMFFGGGAFNIFLMRQFIMQLPRELDEAALIDGASYMRTFFSILAPLIKPAIATVAIIQFMASWGDFMNPLIYLQSNRLFTLALGMRFWDVSQYVGELPEYHLMMAMAAVTTVPCVILFFSAQRIFVQGIAMTGIKG